MKKVHVLHVIGSSKFGGASTIILAIAEMGRRQGWTVDILATDPEFQKAVQANGLGVVTIEGIDRPIRPWKDLRAVWRLWRYLRAHPYEVVHTHTSKGGFVGRLAAKLAHVPVIIHTAHGFAIDEASPWWEMMPYVALERLASCWCDRVVAVSEFHRDWGVQLGIAPKLKFCSIPNGIQVPPPTLSAEMVRAELGIKSDDFLILCPSRIVPYKGIDDLVQAAAELRSMLNAHFQIVVAGSGCAEDRCKQHSQDLGLAGVVTFLGFRTDIRNLLNAADLVVLPSVREGLSISLLEAMAAGKPIIATSIGSNREVGGALLVPPHNPAGLASAMAHLYRHRNAAAQLGLDAAARFQEHYTEQGMVEGYQDLYLDLLSAKGILSEPAPLPASEGPARRMEARRAS